MNHAIKIPGKALEAFNAGYESSFNENWNKAHGYPTLDQYRFLRLVASSVYGIYGKKRKITQKDIKEYVPYTQAQIDFVNKLKVVN